MTFRFKEYESYDNYQYYIAVSEERFLNKDYWVAGEHTNLIARYPDLENRIWAYNKKTGNWKYQEWLEGWIPGRGIPVRRIYRKTVARYIKKWELVQKLGK